MNYVESLILQRLAGMGSGSTAAEQTEAVSGTTPSVAAADNTLYICSAALTSLTVSSIPASGMFEIVFVSGASAAEVALPANVLLPDGVTIEANTVYDMSVRVCSPGGRTVGLAAVQGWPLPEEEEENE